MAHYLVPLPVTGPPAPLADRARIARAALDLGLATPQDVIAWAHREIAQEDRPRSALLELATSGGHRESMLTHLRELASEANDLAAYRGLAMSLAQSCSALPPTIEDVEHLAHLLWIVGPPEVYAQWVAHEARAGLAKGGTTFRDDEVIEGFVRAVSAAAIAQ